MKYGKWPFWYSSQCWISLNFRTIKDWPVIRLYCLGFCCWRSDWGYWCNVAFFLLILRQLFSCSRKGVMVILFGQVFRLLLNVCHRRRWWFGYQTWRFGKCWSWGEIAGSWGRKATTCWRWNRYWWRIVGVATIVQQLILWCGVLESGCRAAIALQCANVCVWLWVTQTLSRGIKSFGCGRRKTTPRSLVGLVCGMMENTSGRRFCWTSTGCVRRNGRFVWFPIVARSVLRFCCNCWKTSGWCNSRKCYIWNTRFWGLNNSEIKQCIDFSLTIILSSSFKTQVRTRKETSCTNNQKRWF